jgi:hypothetical protein
MATPSVLPELTTLFHREEPAFVKLPFFYSLFTAKAFLEDNEFNDLKTAVAEKENPVHRIICHPFYKRISKPY